MTDLRIDRLRLSFEGARGHEHRLRPLTVRAGELLQELLAERPLRPRGHVRLERLDQRRIEVDLALTGDEDTARRIAESLYSALALRLGGSEAGT